MAVPTAKLLLALAMFQAPVRQSQTGIVTGILRTNTGVVLEGLRVAVEPIENPLGAEVLESIGLTDKAGRYVLENVSPGRYRILVGRLGSILYHPGFPERERATTVAVVAGQTTEVADMVFHRTMVSGRVVDLKTGQTPRIDSLTLCCLLDFAASPSPIVRMAKVEALKSTVDDNGAFTFVEVPPGAYALQTVGPGLVSAAHPINVGNEDVSGLEVRVSAGVEVRGRVMDRLKVPVTSVNVTLKPDSTNGTFELINGPMMDGAFIGASLDPSVLNAMPTVRDRIPKPRPVPVTAEGTFSFAGVLPGKYRLEMSAPGGNSFVREIEVGAREPVDASLDLPFTQVTGQIVALDGSPLPSLTGSVRFVASDPDSRILFGFPDDFGRFSVLMTAGEYHLFTDTLNIDRYIQSISDGSRDLQTQRFVVDGLQRQEIRIAIAR